MKLSGPKLIKWIAKEYADRDCFNLSAALSFYAILSLIPLLILVITLVSYFIGRSAGVTMKIRAMVESISPAIQGPFLETVTSLLNRELHLGWLGALMLVLTVHFLFVHLERSMNLVLHLKDKRHFLIGKLLFIAWIIGLTLLLSVPSLVSLLDQLLLRADIDIGMNSYLNGNLWFFLSSWVSFPMLMLIIPRRKFRLLPLVVSGGIFALLLQVARLFFNWGTQFSLVRTNLIYGSLSTLFFGALWLFYFFNILLVCVLGVAWWHQRSPERQK